MKRILWIGICFMALGCSAKPNPPPAQAGLQSIAFPASSSAAKTTLSGSRILLRNATVLDGLNAVPKAGQDILIADGKIERIGPALDATDATVLDVGGQTVLPGLIDAHSHVQSVPGAALRGDTAASVEKQRSLQLRAYLASGVTTILDPAISKPVFEQLKAQVESGNGPSIFALAPFLTPKDGYFGTEALRGSIFADLWAPIEKDETIRQHFQNAAAMMPVGAKVTMEDGMMFPVWPLFSAAQIEIIKKEAAAVNAPIFVHSQTNTEHRLALTLHPYALVHAGLGNEDIAADVLQGIRESGAYVISTLAVYRMEGWLWDTQSMRQPWIEARVPQIQWRTAIDPDTRGRSLDAMIPSVKPLWAPNWAARAVAPMMRSHRDSESELQSSMRAVRALHEAGVPIVMGADAGNWPLFTTFFHGVGSQLEMELLEEAGLPRMEVIRAATSRAAKMLHQENRIGSIQPGMDADLIVVPNNPLEHGMQSLREISWVIKHGVAKSPAAWLAGE